MQRRILGTQTSMTQINPVRAGLGVKFLALIPCSKLVLYRDKNTLPAGKTGNTEIINLFVESILIGIS
jgi:hypothetical protein